jgi:hypothetical protein
MTALPPSSILFSHSKIRSRFTGCGKTLEETYEEIKSGSLSGAFLPQCRDALAPSPPRFLVLLPSTLNSCISAAHPRLVRRQRVRQRE